MPQLERNIIQDKNLILKKIFDPSLVKNFDCGDSDLNEYFKDDAFKHRSELLSETYYLTNNEFQDDFPIALISLSNDGVRKEKLNSEWTSNLHKSKIYTTYPAVKISRLGVNMDFQRMHIGSHLINMIKKLFITDNRTGCRFLIVDAYNKDNIPNFYKFNEFGFFTEKDKEKHTRAMYFDLKRLSIPNNQS